MCDILSPLCPLLSSALPMATWEGFLYLALILRKKEFVIYKISLKVISSLQEAGEKALPFQNLG